MTTRRHSSRGVLCLLVAGALGLAEPPPAAAQLASTPWPMFHQNLRHTGQSPFLGPLFPTGAPEPGDVTFWQGFDKIVNSPSIGPDGTIYLAANFFIFAINPDMTEKWRYQLRADVSP